MTMPMVAAAVAGTLILLQTGLMLAVGLHRASTNAAIGHSDDRNLERKVRRHGNLAESAALFLAALTVAELSGASIGLITMFGAVFVAARLAHAIGFSSLAGSHGDEGSKVFVLLRIVGAFGTLGANFGLGAYLVWELMRYAM